MKPIFLQYPQCGTCRKAAKWLDDNKIDIRSRHIVEDNPSEQELTEWVEKSGTDIHKFFNTSGVVYRELNLKERVKSESYENLIKLLASNGKLIKRPLLVTKESVLVGFREEEWSRTLINK